LFATSVRCLTFYVPLLSTQVPWSLDTKQKFDLVAFCFTLFDIFLGSDLDGELSFKLLQFIHVLGRSHAYSTPPDASSDFFSKEKNSCAL